MCYRKHITYYRIKEVVLRKGQCSIYVDMEVGKHILQYEIFDLFTCILERKLILDC